MKPEDVPMSLVDAAWPVCEREGIPWHDDAVRMILAAVLPAARKAWLAELFGTPEEIAAREAEAAKRTPDDTVRLCEMARPGEHAQRVREQTLREAVDLLDAQPLHCEKHDNVTCTECPVGSEHLRIWADRIAENLSVPASSGPATQPESAPGGEIPSDLRDQLRRALKSYAADIDVRTADALVPVVEASLAEAEQRHRGIAAGLQIELRAAIKAQGDAERERDAADRLTRTAEAVKDEARERADRERTRAEKAEQERDIAHRMLERIPDVHMKFGIVGVVEPEDAACADWCYACRIERAERQRDEALAALTRHAAEAHRRKWVHQFDNPAAFDALHRLGDEILADRDRLLAALKTEQPETPPRVEPVTDADARLAAAATSGVDVAEVHVDLDGEQRDQADTWTVAVEVPISLPAEMRHQLFSAVTTAVSDWEPDDRDGWDADVAGYPTADEPGRADLKQTRAAVRRLADRWHGPDFQPAYADALIAVLENPAGYLKLMGAPDQPEGT